MKVAALILCVLGLMIVAARCDRPARGQAPWSSFRAVAQAPITCTLSRAPKDADGHVIGRYVNLGTIPAQADDRVLDAVLEAGWQYVIGCNFTVVDGVTYDGVAYLPLVLPGSARRPR